MPDRMYKYALSLVFYQFDSLTTLYFQGLGLLFFGNPVPFKTGSGFFVKKQKIVRKNLMTGNLL